MSRRFTDTFSVYRKTATTAATGEVTYTEAAVVENARGCVFSKSDQFAWRDDRGRLAGAWRLLTEPSHDIQVNDTVTSGSRRFIVVFVEDRDLRSKEVVLDVLT